VDGSLLLSQHAHGDGWPGAWEPEPQEGQLGCRRGERCQVLDAVCGNQDRLRLLAGPMGPGGLYLDEEQLRRCFRRPSPSMTVTSGTALQGIPFSMATDSTTAVICLVGQNSTDKSAPYSP
ncbi:MAG: hypothetical protein ACK55Z_24955, partial [bacterium]